MFNLLQHPQKSSKDAKSCLDNSCALTSTAKVYPSVSQFHESSQQLQQKKTQRIFNLGSSKVTTITQAQKRIWYSVKKALVINSSCRHLLKWQKQQRKKSSFKDMCWKCEKDLTKMPPPSFAQCSRKKGLFSFMLVLRNNRTRHVCLEM